MAKDDRDILELLKEELSFVEQGGYGRSVRTPWLPKAAFLDSLTCINYYDPARTRPCAECHLIDFVPNEHHSEEVPCHFIALNDAGETIEDLEAQDNQAKLETTLQQWLRAKIKQIEDQRAVANAGNQSTNAPAPNRREWKLAHPGMRGVDSSPFAQARLA